MLDVGVPETADIHAQRASAAWGSRLTHLYHRRVNFAVTHHAVRAVYALTATIPSISTEI